MQVFNRKRNFCYPCIDDTPNACSRLSQYQQLFCSTFVHQCVVMLTAGIRLIALDIVAIR